MNCVYEIRKIVANPKKTGLNKKYADEKNYFFFLLLSFTFRSGFPVSTNKNHKPGKTWVVNFKNQYHGLI